MKKSFLTILLALILLLGVADVAFAAEDYPTIITDYPELPACEGNQDCKPGQGIFGIPEFIKYIYIFAIGIVGVIGLLAIIMAAFGYVTSAGNPQKASDAKDKIISALLGLILLVGSVVLLRTINPDLLKLQVTESPVVIKPPSDGGGGGGGTECRLTQVSRDPETINSNERVKFTFTLSSACAGQTLSWDIKDLYLLQDGGAYDWIRNWKCTFPDPKQFTTTSGAVSYSYRCTFSQSEMINHYKGAAEKFYLEGSLKLNGVKQTLSAKLYITVRDLKSDGTCCQ